MYPGISRPRFFSRRQPYEISGRCFRENAAANRARVCSGARVRAGRNRQSHRESHGGSLLAEEPCAGANGGNSVRNRRHDPAHQGIAAYGNKGSTDQHSYVQQKRDLVLNFFVTFVEVRNDWRGARFEVEDGITSGDYLEGFLRGSRGALCEKGRESITMSIPDVNAFYIGALIALYERGVGFYGLLVNINAYDQPRVEAGKKAASKLLQLQKQVRAKLSGEGKTAEEIARSADADPEDVFHLLRHLASNDPRIKVATGDEPADDRFSLGESK